MSYDILLHILKWWGLKKYDEDIDRYKFHLQINPYYLRVYIKILLIFVSFLAM